MSSPEPRSSQLSIIKHDRVRIAESAADVPSALPARNASTRCQKSVQLVRENAVVHALQVRCTCGEVTLVEFEYGPSAE